MSELTDLLEQLIGINSVNPDLVPGAPGETEIAHFVQSWLEERGFETHWLEARPGSPSVVGIARGAGGGKSLMLNGHLDTVDLLPFEGNPLEPRLDDGRLFGRGAYDMKGGLAAMLVAAARAKNDSLRGDVLVACVSDEEFGSLGSFELVQHFRADAAIVTEPTEGRRTVAHKGFVWATVTVQGRAAHGSRPDLGLDAIVKMGRVLSAFEALQNSLEQRYPHPLLGHASLHASRVEGGQGLSSYPESCTLTFERRTLPSESRESVEAELWELLEGIKSEDPSFEATLELGLSRKPFEVSESEEIVRLVGQHALKVTGREAALEGVGFWADTSVLQGAGIPCLMYGPCGAGAHAALEWVDVGSLERVAQVLEGVILEFCA